MESLSDKATEKRLEQLEQDKERFLEGVKAEKLKKLYNFPVQADSDQKVSTSINFYIYLTEEDNFYLNYYQGDTVVYEPAPYHLIEVDWLQSVKNKTKDAKPFSSDVMLAGPARRLMEDLPEKGEDNMYSSVMILQDQETDRVRMIAFTSEQKDLIELKILPTESLVENEIVIEEESAPIMR
ncbi:hypothetical protein [Atopococcus tabaci]|uniref:hypothetical protein n=1 Tax=Atopococcus tabaci TaxID=269774 RepID=UPI0024090E6F|nr:hypothetical protein [Atopococcus tabaci]